MKTETVGSRAVLWVDGEVDLATLPRLRNALARLVVDHPGELVAVDLSAVTVLDDSGLGVLMGAAAHARANTGDVALVCAPGRLRDRLALTRLDQALTVAPTLTDLP